jgi:hypothetical protein
MAKEIDIETNTLDSYQRSWEQYESLNNKLSSNELSGSALNYAKNTIAKIEKQGKILDDKTVIIVDEANMIAKHLWEPLTTQVEKSGAKLLVVQDPAQIKAFTAGDIARGLLDRYQAFELTNILRQKIKWQRECSHKLNEHKLAEGLSPYIEAKAITWHREEIECMRRLTEDYVQGVTQNENKTHLFISFLNTKVNTINHRIHNRLKAEGILTGHKVINGQEYSINERIVFTERNENIGDKVKTISEHKEQGIKNGTFGTIIAIDEGKVLSKASLTVKLDDGRVVKFNPEKYKHFSYGYGITINKAEGLTADYSYVLFDQKMNANLTLIAMTRHKEDCKGYLLETEFTDFKDIVQKIGRSQNKELISDYTITPDVKEYYDRVKGYKELVVEVANLLYKDPQTEQEWQRVKNKSTERNKVAREILADYKHHALFVNQANIRKDTIEVYAGIRQRVLSDLEIKAGITVEQYANISLQARNLWNEIKQTHPGKFAKTHPKYEQYLATREDRDSIASVVAESKKLYSQFLNKHKYPENSHIRWHTIETQSKNHYEKQLHNAYVHNLSKEEREAYNTVKSYIEAKKNVIAFVAHFKNNKLQECPKLQNQKVIYSFPIKEERLLFKHEQETRDQLALTIVEGHEKYEKYWPVLKVNTDTLLEHAIKGEERLLAKAYEITAEKEVIEPSSIKALTTEQLEAELARRKQILPTHNYKKVARARGRDMFYQEQMRNVNLNLKRVYVDPEQAKANWRVFTQNHGVESSVWLVRDYPEEIGQIRGINILGFKDEERKIADIYKHTLDSTFEVYSKALQAQADRLKIEQLVQSRIKRELTKIQTLEQNNSYDQRLEQINKVNTSLIPFLENNATHHIIDNASSRLMEYIIDHKARYKTEPSLEDLKCYFFRSKFEATKENTLQREISRTLNLHIYLKHMHQINRQVGIEGRLYAEEYKALGNKHPLEVNYREGNIFEYTNRYSKAAIEEIEQNDKALPRQTKMLEGFIDKAHIQEFALMLNLAHGRFDNLNVTQRSLIYYIITNKTLSSDTFNPKLVKQNQENNNYIRIKEITETYNRSLWQFATGREQHKFEDKYKFIDNISIDKIHYKEIEERSRDDNFREYNLTKYELDKTITQKQLEREKQIELAKEIGDRER